MKIKKKSDLQIVWVNIYYIYDDDGKRDTFHQEHFGHRIKCINQNFSAFPVFFAKPFHFHCIQYASKHLAHNEACYAK